MVVGGVDQMGRQNQVYIIAEAGVNHNGSEDLARKLIWLAKEARADAVKFQTFKAEKLVTRSAQKADYQKVSTGVDESQLQMLKRLELSEDIFLRLARYAKELGIEFLSTPFDEGSVDFLVNEIGVARLKLPSGEITTGPLLHKAASTGKPIILSTGMSTLEEVASALQLLAHGYLFPNETPSKTGLGRLPASTAQNVLREKVAVLHCTTEYPAPYDEANLRCIQTLGERFGVETGLSDHTPGIAIPIAAVALGARIIEKHFTLDRAMAGPDHAASLSPTELSAMVQGIRQTETAVGDGNKQPKPSEAKNRIIVRKSLIAACKIRRGEIFTAINISAKRPGNGISPMEFWDILGKSAPRDFSEDEPIEL